MNKYLVIYNICEIGKTNLEWYIQSIDNLLKIDYSKYDLAISGCMVTNNTKQELLKRYKDKIYINFIDCKLPLNITFNHTVNKIVEKVVYSDGAYWGDPDKMRFRSSVDIVKEIDKRYKTGKHELIWCQTDTDTGYHLFGMGSRGAPVYFYDHDFIVPVGKACNTHVSCFGDKWLQEYGR